VSPALKDKLKCTAVPSATGEQLKDVLVQQGITLDENGNDLLELVAKGKLEKLWYCSTESRDGPFLLLVKAVASDVDSKHLLVKFTGDETLAALLDSAGPAYVSVLRCRPALWKALKECYAAELSVQENR
jgi:hypothetical protein